MNIGKMSNDWYIIHKMYPVLLNLGSFQISSYGFFLTIGIFLGSFAVWRVARAYELDAEKILDIGFLTLGAGFLTSRLVFVLASLEVFDNLTKVFLLNRYPGLSLWGGLLGGLLALTWLTKRNKLNLFQIGDFGMVGFLLAAFFVEIGCLLGGCGIGIETNWFIGVIQAGVIGRRFPIQLFEGLVFLLSFWAFWNAALKFYIQGSLFAKGLILVGLVKFIALFFKSQPVTIKILEFSVNLDLIASAVILGIGLRLYYQVYRKTPGDDLRKFWKFLSDRKHQSQVVAKFYRGCYNHWVNLGIRLRKGKNKLFKLLHVKSNPDNF